MIGPSRKKEWLLPSERSHLLTISTMRFTPPRGITVAVANSRSNAVCLSIPEWSTVPELSFLANALQMTY